VRKFVAQTALLCDGAALPSLEPMLIAMVRALYRGNGLTRAHVCAGTGWAHPSAHTRALGGAMCTGEQQCTGRTGAQGYSQGMTRVLTGYKLKGTRQAWYSFGLQVSSKYRSHGYSRVLNNTHGYTESTQGNTESTLLGYLAGEQQVPADEGRGGPRPRRALRGEAPGG
jgi:hypothetical protein